jgi:hypothetical protein
VATSMQKAQASSNGPLVLNTQRANKNIEPSTILPFRHSASALDCRMGPSRSNSLTLDESSDSIKPSRDDNADHGSLSHPSDSGNDLESSHQSVLVELKAKPWRASKRNSCACGGLLSLLSCLAREPSCPVSRIVTCRNASTVRHWTVYVCVLFLTVHLIMFADRLSQTLAFDSTTCLRKQ